MALSTRELYLILRAKNEAGSALNTLARDFRQAQAAAELMGLNATKAQLASEQSAARAAKAQQEYNLRQLESAKATETQAAAMSRARVAQAELTTQQLQQIQSSDRLTEAQLRNTQSADQNAVSMLQNAKAQNTLDIERARGVAGSDDMVRALRAQNQVLQQQIIDVRNNMVARQDQINSAREAINVTQQQIDATKQGAQADRDAAQQAHERAQAYDAQINTQRDVIAGMKQDIAQRQELISANDREITATRQANAERERSSQRLRDVGGAAVDAGTGMAVGGAVVLAGVYQLTQAAVDYEKQTAMTKTQVRDTGVTIKELGDIGLDVARDFGVSFDSIQEGLYDIFSSTDATVPQATDLLRNFAKAAVAGSVDIKEAGTTTIGVLNAWHLPLSDTTKILDTQFKTVQLGRITYEQLSSTIGRSIPSAVRAGQSFETLSGMIAFMTRSGLSAANSVTSAGRALDLFSNSKVVDRLKEMGINARDASGNFRPLSDVVVELRDHLSKLDPAARAKEIDELFKGSGNNIQARRFWDLVLASDKGAESFKSMVDQVTNSGGSLEQAYGTMSDTMAVRNEKMKNDWKVLAIEAGTALFPAMESIVKKLSELADWFERLSPGQQSFLAWAVLIGGIVMIAAGAILILGGALTVLAGILGIGVGALALIIGAVVAFAAIWILAYEKVQWFHDAVNWWFQHLWEVIKWFVSGWKGALTELWDALVNTGKSLADTFGTLRDAISTFLNWFTTGWSKAFTDAKNAVTDFWNWITGANSSGSEGAKFPLDGFWSWFINGWNKCFTDVKNAATSFWSWITGSFNSGTGQAKFPLDGFWSWFINGWKQTFASAQSAISSGWNAITSATTTAINAIRSAASAFWSWFTSGWASTFASARSAVTSGWSAISSATSSTISAIRSAVTSFFSWFTSGWSSTLSSARSAVSSGMSAILSVIQSIISAIRGAFQSLISSGYGIGSSIISGITSGVLGAAGNLASAAANVVLNALAAARAAISINSPSLVFAKQVGAPISEGMAKGVLDNAKMLNKAVSHVTLGAVGAASTGVASAGRLNQVAQSQALSQLASVGTASAGSLTPAGGYGNRGGNTFVVNVYTNELDPRRHAMMLGTELEKAMG